MRTRMRKAITLICCLDFILAVGQVAARAEIVLTVHLLPDADIIEVMKSSGRRAAEHIVVPFGSPISCRISLRNTGDSETKPMVVSLLPEDGCLAMYLRAADGKEIKIKTFRWEVRSRVLRPRPMRPGEEIQFETWMFGNLDVTPNRISGSRYIFESPGRYEMFCTYQVRTSASVHEGSSVSPQEVIRSNVVTIDVQQPKQWWAALADRGIVDAVERGVDLARLTGEEVQQLMDVIDSANEPVFSRWLRRQMKDNRVTHEK